MTFDTVYLFSLRYLNINLLHITPEIIALNCGLIKISSLVEGMVKDIWSCHDIYLL